MKTIREMIVRARLVWGTTKTMSGRISENLTYKHLLNITGIGYRPENVKVPSEEEIWG